ncbi:HhH-GPD-type base excision DNA repair protein [Propionibacteriaceae bacterium G1746]|uniref:HhH-GPD-type base excision DNA repair protein n=1 Tax=Aestuariimicrobium sp. G57 TaxID=3418485 RepID=UPI003C1A8FFC
MADFWLTGNPDADALLARNDNALLCGMLLDQQVTMEKAFSGPAVLAERMGGFDVAKIAALPADEFVAIASVAPAIHRFPGSMGTRLHQLCTVLVDEWDGEAANLWRGPDGALVDGATVLKRLKALPGFGQQKAQIFLAMLGKTRGLHLPGWQQSAGDYGQPGFRSAADISDPESLAKVRATKKEAKAAAKAAKLG